MLQNNSNYHILGYLLPKLIFTQRMLDECLYYFRIGLEPPDYIFLKFEHCLCKGGESGIYIVGGRASVCVRLVVGRAKGGSKRRGSGSGGGRPLAHHSERVTARVQGNRRWICDAISKPIQWVFLSEKRSSDLFFTSFSNLSNMDETFLSQRIASFTFIIWFHGEQACYNAT